MLAHKDKQIENLQQEIINVASNQDMVSREQVTYISYIYLYICVPLTLEILQLLMYIWYDMVEHDVT